MMNQHKAYIAGIGMITPIGANTKMTVASVNAGISGYKVSRYFNQQEYPITMANVPEEVFTTFEDDIVSGRNYSGQCDHIIKMAIMAIKEAVSGINGMNSIPLVLAMPEEGDKDKYVPIDLLLANLLNKDDIPLCKNSVQLVSTGRSAGIQGLSIAMDYLYQKENDYVLLGGSDSYFHASRIYEIDATERLLAPNRQDGFVAGEGAGFILLTRNPEKAISHQGEVITISQPGISAERGHLYSEEPYKGEGLSLAFRQALSACTGNSISTVYSSMNGERYWAKEYGVATLRNKKYFKEDFKTEHPADCFGDLGVATGSTLIGLSASNLLTSKIQTPILVCSSSDGAWRSAVLVEKQSMQNIRHL